MRTYKRPLPLWVAYVLFLPILLPYWIVIAIWQRIDKIRKNHKEERATQWAWEMVYLKQQVRYRHDLWRIAEDQKWPNAHSYFNDYLDAQSRYERKKNS